MKHLSIEEIEIQMDKNQAAADISLEGSYVLVECFLTDDHIWFYKMKEQMTEFMKPISISSSSFILATWNQFQKRTGHFWLALSGSRASATREHTQIRSS